MPRLDWQMWFAALNPEGAREWLVPLLQRLLEGSPQVLALLRDTPFPGAPPRYVRLVYYQLPLQHAGRAGCGRRVVAVASGVGYLTQPLSLGEPPR